MKEYPRRIIINYIVAIYKDMELADEIEYCSSFGSSYQSALKFFRETALKTKQEQYVALELEVSAEYKDGIELFLAPNILITDNFERRKYES